MTENQYTFTGRRFDEENGMYHFHFRQYDPATGVWTTPDPIGILGGINYYGFVGNNPANKVDWLGLWSSMGEGYGGDLGGASEVEGPSSHNDSNETGTGSYLNTHKDELANALFGETDKIGKPDENNDMKSIALAGVDLVSAILSQPNSISLAGITALGMITDISTILNSGVPGAGKKGLGLGLSLGGLAVGFATSSPFAIGLGFYSLGLSWSDYVADYPDVVRGNNFIKNYKGRCR